MAILGGIGSSIGGIAHTLGFIAEFAFVIGLGAFVVYFVMWRRRFNVEVETQAVRAADMPGSAGFKIFKDKGGYFRKKDGYEEFRLLKDKVAIKPPALNYLYPTPKGNKIYFRKFGPKEYVPVLLGDIMTKDNPGTVLNFVGEDQDVINWSILQMLRNSKAFGKLNWIEKYGGYLIFGLAVVGCIVLIYLILQKFDVLQNVASSFATAANRLASAATSNAQLVPAK